MTRSLVRKRMNSRFCQVVHARYTLALQLDRSRRAEAHAITTTHDSFEAFTTRRLSARFLLQAMSWLGELRTRSLGWQRLLLWRNSNFSFLLCNSSPRAYREGESENTSFAIIEWSSLGCPVLALLHGVVEWVLGRGYSQIIQTWPPG